MRMPRRAAAAALAVTVAAAGGALVLRDGGDPSGGSARAAQERAVTGLGRPPGSWRPYGGESPFNRPVQDRPRVDPRSPAIVAAMVGDGPPDSLFTFDASAPSAAERDFSRPLYWADRDDPLYRVRCTDFGGDCPINGMKVRVPAQARAAGGSDGHLTVVDEGWDWSFYRVQAKGPAGGELRVGFGDRIAMDGDGLDGGGGAARFGGLAGRVRWEPLRAAIDRRGSLPHALFMTVRCARAGAFVPPATAPEEKRACSDQEGRPEMGRRFWLDMTPQEIDGLRAPEWLKVIARTMARYGAFVGDQGGSAWGLQFESAEGFLSLGRENPFALYGSSRPGGVVEDGGTYAFLLRDGVPWDERLRALVPEP